MDESPALQVTGAGDQVWLSKAVADLGGAGRGGVRGLAIAGSEMLLNGRQQQ